MSDRYFLDTNIFLYTFDKAAPEKASRARDLIRSGLPTGKAIISYQVVQEFFSVAFRRFQPPMTIVDAEYYLSVTLGPLLAVYPSQSLFGEAVRLTGKQGLSWYDSLIVAAAMEGDCGILYSEDFQHGRKFDGLVVRNPFL
jgi:predicted nucleic acid-binding protein